MEFELPSVKRLSDISKSELLNAQSLNFALFVSCYAQSRGVRSTACEHFLEAYPRSYGAMHVKKELELCQPGATEGFNDRMLGPLIAKAASAPATTTSGTWAGSLVGAEALEFGFLALTHASSIMGKIPGLRLAPFNVSVPLQSQEAAFAWVSEGASKPVSAMAFAQATVLKPLKAAGITAYSQEFMRNISPETAVSLRDSLRNAIVSFQDRAFLSSDAAIAGQRPAGILAGRTPVTSTGNLAADFQTLLNTYYAARPGASEDTVVIASPQKAAALKTLNAGGGSGYVTLATDATSGVIVADGRAIVVGDGGLSLSMSGAASVQMDSAPTVPSASTVFRSFFQDNLIGIRLERTLDWFIEANGAQFLA